MLSVTTTDLETSCVESDFHLCTSTAKFILDVVSKVLRFILGTTCTCNLEWWLATNCVSVLNILYVQTFEGVPNTCIVKRDWGSLLSADIRGFSEFKGSTFTRLFCLGMRYSPLVFSKVVVNLLPGVDYFIWKHTKFVGKSFFLESNKGARERDSIVHPHAIEGLCSTFSLLSLFCTHDHLFPLTLSACKCCELQESKKHEIIVLVFV